MKKKGIEGKLTKGDLLQFIIIALVVLLIRVFLFYSPESGRYFNGANSCHRRTTLGCETK